MRLKMESIERINQLLNSIPITNHNKDEIEGAKKAIAEGDFNTALSIIQNLNKKDTQERKKFLNMMKRKEMKKIMRYKKILMTMLIYQFFYHLKKMELTII